MASRPLRIALLVAALGACAHTQQGSSVADSVQAPDDQFAEMDYWDGVAERRAITNADAVHGLLLSFARSAGSHAERLELARKRGWIGKDDALAANETAEVGWIAKAVVMECRIKGGLTLRVLGPKERYAVRELNHMGWLPKMSKAQAISGLQFIALLGEAEDHLARAADRPSEDM